MDRIELRELRVLAFCGVLPEEQARRQPFALDLDIEADLSAAGVSDDLADTVDYGAICDRIAELADRERVALMERFAQLVADAVLACAGVNAVTVSIRKLRPPVPQDVGSSGVTIRRTAS